MNLSKSFFIGYACAAVLTAGMVFSPSLVSAAPHSGLAPGTEQDTTDWDDGDVQAEINKLAVTRTNGTPDTPAVSSPFVEAFFEKTAVTAGTSNLAEDDILVFATTFDTTGTNLVGQLIGASEATKPFQLQTIATVPAVEYYTVVASKSAVNGEFWMLDPNDAPATSTSRFLAGTYTIYYVVADSQPAASDFDINGTTKEITSSVRLVYNNTALTLDPLLAPLAKQSTAVADAVFAEIAITHPSLPVTIPAAITKSKIAFDKPDIVAEATGSGTALANNNVVIFKQKFDVPNDLIGTLAGTGFQVLPYTASVSGTPYTFTDDPATAAGSSGNAYWITTMDDETPLPDTYKFTGNGSYYAYYAVKNADDDSAFDNDTVATTITNSTLIAYTAFDPKEYLAIEAKQADDTITTSVMSSTITMALETAPSSDLPQLPYRFDSKAIQAFKLAALPAGGEVVTFTAGITIGADVAADFAVDKVIKDALELNVLHVDKDSNVTSEAFVPTANKDTAEAKAGGVYWLEKAGTAIDVTKADIKFEANGVYTVYYSIKDAKVAGDKFDTNADAKKIDSMVQIAVQNADAAIASDTISRTAGIQIGSTDVTRIVYSLDPWGLTDKEYDAEGVRTLTGSQEDYRAQAFTVTGVNPGDTVVFKRTFTYDDVLDANNDPIVRNISTQTLGMYKYGANNASAFTLIKRVDGTPIEEPNGKFWIVKGTTDQVTSLDIDDTVAFENGITYTLYFAIEDGGSHDDGRKDGTITDPNQPWSGLTSHSDGSSGCTVGTTANYDLALMLLAIMGVVGFRVVRNRKA